MTAGNACGRERPSHPTPECIDPWQCPIATPSLQHGDVHVWRASFNGLMPMLPRLQRLLSEDERQRAAQCYSLVDCRHFAIGRGMLRAMLGAYLEIEPERIVLDQTEHGKPFVHHSCNPVDIRFNLSHSGNWLVCAMTCARDVGIDIEQMRSDVDCDGVAAWIFSAAELRRFEDLTAPAKPAALFDAWAHKEAYVKAIGAGLSMPLTDIAVLCSLDRTSSGWTTVARDDSRWSMRRLHAVDGYTAALVVEGPVSNIAYFDWR